MKEIALEDIATLFVTEFIKTEQHKSLYRDSSPQWERVPFLKMNFSKRRKIISKILDKMDERTK